jgi:hypothetical protein
MQQLLEHLPHIKEEPLQQADADSLEVPPFVSFWIYSLSRILNLAHLLLHLVEHPAGPV